VWQLSTSGLLLRGQSLRGPCRLPQARIIPGISGRMVTRPDGSVLNTCSVDVLVEMLRFLKRSFWCAWLLIWPSPMRTLTPVGQYPLCARMSCVCILPVVGC
jgi:hypothetical protein